jgi:hypothetical protein
LPKSPERLPVENADATLEELEALPNGEALRTDTIVSGIAAAMLQGDRNPKTQIRFVSARFHAVLRTEFKIRWWG